MNAGKRQFALLTVLLSWLLWVSGCRTNDDSGNLPTSLLTDPTIFIPAGTLRAPEGIAVDNTGDVWVADTFHDAVRRYSNTGSERVSLPGMIRPRMMGLDRFSSTLLVVADRKKIYRIDPAGDTASIVFDANVSPIDTTSVFDLRTGVTRARIVQAPLLGDIDGGQTGDIYCNAVASSAENFVLRIRGTQCDALTYSPIRPLISADIMSRFLSVDRFGTVFTSFVTFADQQVTEVFAFGVFPGNLTSSAALPSGIISPGTYGSGIDNTGILFIADATSQQLLILSTSSGQTLETIPIPAITGLTRPSPRDVAVASDGSVFVVLTDLSDTGNSLGAVLKFGRSVQH